MLPFRISQQGQWQILRANGRLFMWATMSANCGQSPSWHDSSRDFTLRDCTKTMKLLSVSSNVWKNCQLLQYDKFNIYTSVLTLKVHIQLMFLCGYDVEENGPNFVRPPVSRAPVGSVWMNECKGNTQVSPVLLRLPERQKKNQVGREWAGTNRVKLGSERGWLCWLSLLLWKQHDRADWLCRGIAPCASYRHTHCTHTSTMIIA